MLRAQVVTGTALALAGARWGLLGVGVEFAGRGFHRRFVGRYADGSPLVHSCSSAACYCANPAHAGDWAKDTVVIGDTSPPSGDSPPT